MSDFVFVIERKIMPKDKKGAVQSSVMVVNPVPPKKTSVKRKGRRGK